MKPGRRRFLSIGAGAALAACAPRLVARKDFSPSFGALQNPWPLGLPTKGSYFPLGLYNVLADGEAGQVTPLSAIQNAGFNTVVAWGAQDAQRMMEQTAALSLRVVWPQPNDAVARLISSFPNLAAIEIDHEPTLRVRDPADFSAIDAMAARKKALRDLGLDQPAMVFNSPGITPPFDNHWRRVAAASDIVGFWKYPFYRAEGRSLAGPRGLPEVTLSAGQAGVTKPVWPVLQAMRSPILDWRWPTPQQLWAQAFAAIIHGASGLFWFCLDSRIARNGQVIGIAPAPQEQYTAREEPPPFDKPPLPANPGDLAQSKLLWEELARLNHFLAAHALILLGPTLAAGPDVFIRGSSLGQDPLRLMIKSIDEKTASLWLVNIEDVPLTLRLHWPRAVRIESMVGKFVGEGQVIERDISAFAAHAWLIRFS